MNSVQKKLATIPIQRWIKAIEFVDKEAPTNKPLALDLSELYELVDKQQLAKRSKPSYKWKVDDQERWYRVWFKESNLTIQIDLYFANNKFQMNMYEIDVETCTTALSILDWLYHSMLGKKWGSPELLWATMEVLDEASEKKFGRTLCEALAPGKPLNWSAPKK
ncbi:hypothetical protein DSM106972_094470 [Dulcicalothrix desertica PCC 7102]|uniref:Uncharacterized protein n=1 Tax=Dulcicalothrix desertica PCC 7102 TaxID=232991 RepID=A0A3S5K2V2_9CYAN|nr:hypothetical protein [Dulcicalothrix desertica]RUS93976.1 hypothetical protein DSM106972_094470 [Dulcicalothrix desertica PCC 7102]TWH62659.1 hypothetical protein CAL7102_00164 [Dulcicalothrix desertica PCC 7102]